YDAISYVWGAPLLVFPLYHVNDGSQIFVTENLDAALRRLGHHLDDTRLWADAVCINQQDQEEKALQIPRMVDIFRSASKVVAWLG
ncbi:hypothetical protein T440DRAFT_351007, partial [Plenodomus tracheiphilus IPT5]